MADRRQRSSVSEFDPGDGAGARKTAYRFLSFRVRSREEVARRLREKGFDSRTVEKTLEELTRLGYLDDLRFAETWLRIRMGRRGYGRHLLRHELREKGVAQEIIDQALREREADEKEAARRVLAKRFPETHDERETRILPMAFEYLRRRGFPSDLIASVLKQRREADS